MYHITARYVLNEIVFRYGNIISLNILTKKTDWNTLSYILRRNGKSYYPFAA